MTLHESDSHAATRMFNRIQGIFMRTLLMVGLLTFAGMSSAWAGCPSGTIAQGVDSNGQPICVIANVGNGTTSGTPPPGSGGAVSSGGSSNHGTPIPESTFKDQCMSNLSALASQKLQSQLSTDKAVTSQVSSSAAITTGELGTSCSQVCDAYAMISHKISWAHLSVGYISEPEHTQQKIFGQMPQPPMPGKADLDKCLPQQATMNWCPKSGSGVGAGPSRIENPLDKIRVCITGGDALQHMNFSDKDIARNCARPNIIDAAQRIKAEHQCVTDAVMAEEKAKQAAANGTAQLPIGNIGLSPGARKKP
jgi:hypothetical protein